MFSNICQVFKRIVVLCDITVLASLCAVQEVLQRYPCLDLTAIFRLAREKIQKVIFFFLFSTAETLL